MFFCRPKRKHQRHVVYAGVYVESPMRCSVADVSAAGAKPTLKDPASLPDEFLLRLRPVLGKWCRVVWRGEGQAESNS